MTLSAAAVGPDLGPMGLGFLRFILTVVGVSFSDW